MINVSNIKLLTLASILVLLGRNVLAEDVSSSAAANEPVVEKAIAESVKDDKGAQQSVEVCWSNWQKAENLVDGKNDRNGHLILVSHQQEAVNQDPNARNWLGARRAAFETAELNARAALANTMKTEIKSDRSAAQRLLGGDDAAPNLDAAVKQLSIADKADVLVDKALDDQISKYDPSWNRGASPDKKKEAIVTLQARLQDNIASHSALFAAGAFTVVQCEGKSTQDNGKYSILVGMIWSPKLAKVAEAIWNPSLKLQPEAPQASLNDQFAAFSNANPDWLAYTMGARVFTNEKGERVIVGFGTAPRSSMMSVDKRRASLEALASIQHFVGENVEAADEFNEVYQRQDTGADSQFFDNSTYQNKVTARSQNLQLKGAVEVLSWRGDHPWSNSKMEVVALAWTPSWAADSEQAASMMQAVEKRMSEQGAVPNAAIATKKRFKGEGAAAPTHAGASSSARDF